MNEKPEGTPNPLNPNPEPVMIGEDSLDANPSETVGQPAAPASETMAQPEPVSQPVEPVAQPEAQPAPDVVIGGQPKKKKTGLIIGVFVCLLIAVGCGVAAILLTMKGGGDPVTAAIGKLLSGNTSSNTSLSGSFEVMIDNEDSPISAVKVELDGKFVQNSMVNSSSAKITLTPTAGSDKISFEASEVYSSDGSLYIKLDGVGDALEDIIDLTTTKTVTPTNNLDIQTEMNCYNEAGELTNCEEMVTDLSSGMFDEIVAIVDLIDGEWLMITTDEMASLFDGYTSETGSLTCMLDLMDDVKSNNNSAAELYNKNPFVTSTTEGLTVSKHSNTLYKLGFDSEKLKSYLDSAKDNDLLNKVSSCMGQEVRGSIDTEALTDALSELPDIYIEIDSNNDITRFYTKFEMPSGAEVDCVEDYYSLDDEAYLDDDGFVDDEEWDEMDGYYGTDCLPDDSSFGGTVIVDFDFAYPETINIAEPTEYTTFSELFQQLFSLGV